MGLFLQHSAKFSWSPRIAGDGGFSGSNFRARNTDLRFSQDKLKAPASSGAFLADNMRAFRHGDPLSYNAARPATARR
jgi:hypothetical protein